MPDALPVPAPAPAPVVVAPPDPDCFLTLKEVARRLNVTIRYVRQLRQSGALPVVPLSPRRLRVRPEDLERLIQERMARAARRGTDSSCAGRRPRHEHSVGAHSERLT